MGDSRGFTLISTIVAAAITAIVGLAVASMIADVFGLMGRSQDLEVANGVQQTALGLLMNRTACNDALRSNAAGTKIQFTPPGAAPHQVDVFQLVTWSLPPGGGVPTTFLFKDQQLGKRIKLRNLRFVESTPPVRGRVTIGNLNYDTYVGNIELDFGYISASLIPFTTGMRIRKIPLTVAVHAGGINPPDPATREIVMCHYDATFSQLCQRLGGTLDGSGNCVFPNTTAFNNFDCQATAPACVGTMNGHPNCQTIYYVQGIRSDSTPNCACRIICPTAGFGVAGSGSGSGSGSGGTGSY